MAAEARLAAAALLGAAALAVHGLAMPPILAAWQLFVATGLGLAAAVAAVAALAAMAQNERTRRRARRPD